MKKSRWIKYVITTGNCPVPDYSLVMVKVKNPYNNCKIGYIPALHYDWSQIGDGQIIAYKIKE